MPECEDVESLFLRDCASCRGLYGSKLILVKDFSLENLPEALRSQLVLDHILMQERIAVKLHVKKSGGAGYSDASGWACVSEDSLVEYSFCPIEDCPFGAGNSHKAYGGITVFTNKHVVSTKDEGVNCKVVFFYDERDESQREEMFLQKGDNSLASSGNESFSGLDGVAWGLCVKQSKESKDLVAIETIFHDPRLFKIVATSSTERLRAWAKMPDTLKKELKEHVIVISHPHGRPKMVSVGKLICLEVASPKDEAIRETQYSAATCRASSGALVLSGHYPHRPFTHSSKRKIADNYINYSMSY